MLVAYVYVDAGKKGSGGPIFTRKVRRALIPELKELICRVLGEDKSLSCLSMGKELALCYSGPRADVVMVIHAPETNERRERMDEILEKLRAGVRAMLPEGTSLELALFLGPHRVVICPSRVASVVTNICPVEAKGDER